jgi:hypothetical protein
MIITLPGQCKPLRRIGCPPDSAQQFSGAGSKRRNLLEKSRLRHGATLAAPQTQVYCPAHRHSARSS